MNIAIFYGSSTCYTEIAAEKIAAEIKKHFIEYNNFSVGLFNVASEHLSLSENYHALIMGIPTWDFGELQEDWENIWPEFDTLDLHGKTVALFGLGDQIGYPQWFLDAMGYLHDKVVVCGAKTTGQWPTVGYQFEASRALTEDKNHFVGLALDEENEFELTDDRIRVWCSNIAVELKRSGGS